VILYRGNHVDHFLLAVDKRSGKQLWKVPQDEPFSSELACTSCPIVVNGKLIVHTARSLQALEISSGKQVWVAKCATTATSTPILAGKEVIVAAWNKMGEAALRPTFPSFAELISAHDKDNDQLISRDELPRLMIFHRPEGAEAPQNGAAMRFERADKNRNGEITADEWDARIRQLNAFRANYKTHGMLAIPIESKGIVTADQIWTLETQGIPEVPSPLFHDGFVYFVKNGGVLTCLELETGERASRVRTRGRGTHYASPIIADGKLFSTAGDGTITVMSLGPNPGILAVNDMQDGTYATPAIVDSTLYVRTHQRLFAFGLRP
jgi:outer membrane protein assembly factor BamB